MNHFFIILIVLFSFLYRYEIIYIVYGNLYINAEKTFFILIILAAVYYLNYFYLYSSIIQSKEYLFLISVILGLCVNITFNILAYSYSGSLKSEEVALSLLVGELATLISAIYFYKKYNSSDKLQITIAVLSVLGLNMITYKYFEKEFYINGIFKEIILYIVMAFITVFILIALTRYKYRYKDAEFLINKIPYKLKEILNSFSK
jgi:O-antigen/teichoic acid export membrane protein